LAFQISYYNAVSLVGRQGGDYTKLFSKQKAIGEHKIYCSISQMIITTNIMLKLANFSQNLFAACQTLCAKKELVLILFVRKSFMHC